MKKWFPLLKTLTYFVLYLSLFFFPDPWKLNSPPYTIAFFSYAALIVLWGKEQQYSRPDGSLRGFLGWLVSR